MDFFEEMQNELMQHYFGFGRGREKGIRLEFKFNSIEDFYKTCLEPNLKEGALKQWTDHHNEDRKDFRGLSLTDIHKYKYHYQPGVSKLEENKDDILIDGKSSFKNKWDDVDGEEMSMDRFYDEMAYLNKRVRRKGFLNGKFIKIFITISENAMTSYEQMLNKTFTAVSIIDYLESMGYRTEVYAITEINNMGTYQGKSVDEQYSEVPIKQLDETLNISLLLTMLSPWAFRYWHFLLYTGQFNTNYHLGSGSYAKHKSKPGELYISGGECLTKEDSKLFINQIKEMYDQDEEDVY